MTDKGRDRETDIMIFVYKQADNKRGKREEKR